MMFCPDAEALESFLSDEDAQTARAIQYQKKLDAEVALMQSVNEKLVRLGLNLIILEHDFMPEMETDDGETQHIASMRSIFVNRFVKDVEIQTMVSSIVVEKAESEETTS